MKDDECRICDGDSEVLKRRGEVRADKGRAGTNGGLVVAQVNMRNSAGKAPHSVLVLHQTGSVVHNVH